MKKYLTLLFVWLLSASAAWGYDVVFDATVDIGDGGSEAAPFVISKAGVTVSVSQGVSNGQQYRVYKGQNLTICAEHGMLKRILLYCTAPDDQRYGPANFIVNVGSYSSEDIVGCWQGEAQCVTFTAQTSQVRITKIIVSVDAEGVMPPAISPVGGTYYEPIEVSITCYEDNATVHYTLDGTEPTAESPEYTAPFVVDSTTTVKAIARIDTSLSAVVSARYVIEEGPDPDYVNVHNIAELLSQPVGTKVRFLNPVYALAQNTRATLYVTDDTGFALFYGSTGQTYQLGDEIPAGFTGEARIYDGEPELAKLAGFLPAVGNRPIEPETISVTRVAHEMFAHLVLIPNVKLSHQDGNTYLLTDAEGNTCEAYFGTLDCEIPADLDVAYDVYGIVGSYGRDNTIYQLLPISLHRRFGFGFGDIDDPEIPDGTRIRFTYDATVMLQNNNYLYARDQTGYALIYGNVGQTYQQGDVIPDGFTCAKQTYQGRVELASPQDFERPIAHHELEAESATIDQFPYCLYHYVTPGTVFLQASNDPVGVATTGIMTDMNGNSCRYRILSNIIPYGWTIPANSAVEVFGVVDLYGSGNQAIPLFIITKISGITPPVPVDVASIGELYGLPKGQPAHFTTPLIAVWQWGDNMYVKDVQGQFGFVYGNVSDTFLNGSIINDAECCWTDYHGAPQIIPVSETFVSSGTGPAVEPDEMTIEEIHPGMLHSFLQFEGVSLVKGSGYNNYVMSDGTGEIKVTWPGWLPRPEPYPIGQNPEPGIALVNMLIDLILSNDNSIWWDGTYNVIGFVEFFDSDISIRAGLITPHGGYDLASVDINGDGELSLADVNELIELILRN